MRGSGPWSPTRLLPRPRPPRVPTSSATSDERRTIQHVIDIDRHGAPQAHAVLDHFTTLVVPAAPAFLDELPAPARSSGCAAASSPASATRWRRMGMLASHQLAGVAATFWGHFELGAQDPDERAASLVWGGAGSRPPASSEQPSSARIDMPDAHHRRHRAPDRRARPARALQEIQHRARRAAPAAAEEFDQASAYDLCARPSRRTRRACRSGARACASSCCVPAGHPRAAWTRAAAAPWPGPCSRTSSSPCSIASSPRCGAGRPALRGWWTLTDPLQRLEVERDAASHPVRAGCTGDASAVPRAATPMPDADVVAGDDAGLGPVGLPGLSGPSPPGWTLASLAELRARARRCGSGRGPALRRRLRRATCAIIDIDDTGRLRPDSWASIPESPASPIASGPAICLFARSGATAGKTYLYDPGRRRLRPRRLSGPLRPARRSLRSRLRGPVDPGPDLSTWVRGPCARPRSPTSTPASLAAFARALPPLDEQLCHCPASWAPATRPSTPAPASSRSSASSLRRHGARPAHARRVPPRAAACAIPWLEPGASRHPARPPAARLAKSCPWPSFWPMSSLSMRSGLLRQRAAQVRARGRGYPAARHRQRPGGRVRARVPALRAPEARPPPPLRRARPGDVLIATSGSRGRPCEVPQHIGEALSSRRSLDAHVRSPPLRAAPGLAASSTMRPGSRRLHPRGPGRHHGPRSAPTSCAASPARAADRGAAHRPSALERLRARIAAERASSTRERLRERLREDLVTGRVRIGDPAAFASIGVVPMLLGLDPPRTRTTPAQASRALHAPRRHLRAPQAEIGRRP